MGPQSGKELKKLGDHKKSVYSVAFSGDGKYLASTGEDMTIKVWDVAGQKELKSLSVKENLDAFTAVAFLPDGNRLLSTGYDRYLRLWDVAAGKELKKLGPASSWLYGLALAKDGKAVATVGYGGVLNTWDLDSGKPSWTYQLRDKKGKPRICYCVAFTPDGTALAVGSESDNAVFITPIGKK